MYFSFESTSRTVARVHARPRSVRTPLVLSRLAISDSNRPSSTNQREIWLTTAMSASGPGCKITRSVCRLLCSPRESWPFIEPDWSISTRRGPDPAGPPGRKPSPIRRHCPANPFRGRFAAVFARHRALDALDDGGHGRAVVLELLGAVGDLNP